MKKTESSWNPRSRLLTTRISGDVDAADVARWKASLEEALARIPDGSAFKMFVNLHGFKAVNTEAHQLFRTIIPLTLADYGFRAGYVDLFENVVLPLQNKRGIRCVAAVHVHQEETKIHAYESRFGKETERFFTDPLEGERWIGTVDVA